MFKLDATEIKHVRCIGRFSFYNKERDDKPLSLEDITKKVYEIAKRYNEEELKIDYRN